MVHPDLVEVSQGLGITRPRFPGVPPSPSGILINVPSLQIIRFSFLWYPYQLKSKFSSLVTGEIEAQRVQESHTRSQGGWVKVPDVKCRKTHPKPQATTLCDLSPGIPLFLPYPPSSHALRSDNPAIPFWMLSSNWFRSLSTGSCRALRASTPLYLRLWVQPSPRPSPALLTQLVAFKPIL